MKIQNIFKIGVLSIVLLSLLISPILKLVPQEAMAQENCTSTPQAYCKKDCVTGDVPIVGTCPEGQKCCLHWSLVVPLQATTTTEIISESEAAKWCDKIYGEGIWKGVPFVNKNWWGYTLCVMQLSAIEGIGAAISGVTKALIGYILWALNPVTYGGFVTNTAVQGVWSVLRNFMNLALVLILVFIAIATILGIKKYRWQETLWKLVIVALLINFSLIIPGIILDASHFITYTFLNLAGGDDLNIAGSMMKILATEELAREGKYQLPMIDDITATYDSSTKETSVNASGWGLGMGKSLIVATLLLLVGIFVIIALVAIFFTMIFRASMIIALLCVAPIAFAAWILPNTAGLWKTWWDHFLKWCTFPITFALMLYIGIYIMTEMNISTVTLAEENAKIGLIATVVQMILFSMFLVGGLIFSIQSGGAISSLALKQTNKIGRALGSAAGLKALKGVTGSQPWKNAQERLKKSKLAPIHDLGISMEKMPAKIRLTELKNFEDYYKKASNDEIRHDLEVHKNDRARVAIGLNELTERKKIIYEKDSEFVNIAKNQSNLNVPGLKKVHPELHVDYFTKPEDMNKEITQIKQGAPGISDDEAKKLARINLTTKRVKEADPDAIKLGNWDNILERLEQQGILENKGTQYIDYFFRSLWDADTTPEGYAAMFRSMDIGKRPKWAQEFVNSIGRTTHKSQKEVVAELDENNFYRNRFLTELLPPKPTP